MTIPGIGKDLHWWHGLTGVAAAALLGCIARDWENGAIIAAGFCGIGIGSWIDHPLRTRLLSPSTKIVGHVFRVSVLGLAFDILGTTAVAVGVWRGI